MELPIFKRLTAYAMQRKFGTHVSWTHITRAYDVEMREIVYFKSSGQPYMFSRANRGGRNPLEALIAVLPVVLPPTPLLSVLILEAECVLLGMALDDWRTAETKLEKALDQLRSIIDNIPVALMVGDEIVTEPVPLHTLRGRPFKALPAMVDETLDYECENCIGMIEHGCYCKSMGATAPGGPSKGIPADPGEDDDL